MAKKSSARDASTGSGPGSPRKRALPRTAKRPAARPIKAGDTLNHIGPRAAEADRIARRTSTARAARAWSRWKSPARWRAASGISSAISSACPRAARSCCSIAAGTTALVWNASWASATTPNTTNSCARRGSSSASWRARACTCSNCKKRARLNVSRYILKRMPYKEKVAESIGSVDPLIVGRPSLVPGVGDDELAGSGS